MILVLALTVGVLVATGTYLVLQRALTRVILGFALLAHGVNLLLLASGGRAGEAPLADGETQALADPLPQALALTAIVISFGITALLAALAFRSWQISSNDEVQDDLEDLRVARGHTIEGDEVP